MPDIHPPPRIYNINHQRMDQLKNYAEWDRQYHPDGEQRRHILEWAIDEILSLRKQLEASRRELSRYKNPPL